MTRRSSILLTLLLAAGPAWAAPPVTQAQAAKIADATVATWLSMDAARIKAMYAPGIVGFDYGVAALSTTRAQWDEAQDQFAAAGMDHAVQVARKIQILAPDIFVVSGSWALTSSTVPANDGGVRCTDVFQRNAAGRWLIVNEHCSAVPGPA